MNLETLKYIITNHRERFLSGMDLIPRELLVQAGKFMKSREIIFITGIRRSGKSSLMRLICKQLIDEQSVSRENILFINFEDERFIGFTVSEFDLLFKTYKELEDPKGKVYLFFDEIQQIEGWERWINRLYEFEDVKITITGSNASLLGSEISTVLTGRNRQLYNYPFSFKEFLWQQGLINLETKYLYQEKIQIELKRKYLIYIENGGFPEVIKNNDITLLDQYFKDIIYRDIIARHSIRNIIEMKELALYLISNIGTLTSYDGLKKVISATNTTTIKNFLHILEDTYLIVKLSLFDFSIKKQIYNPNKYYTSDIGFYSALGFRFSENKGHKMENLVCIELLRRNKEIFYWKSSKGFEVDFIIKQGNKPYMAIQVCAELTKMNEEREIRSLLSAANELQISELIILNEDTDTVITIDCITIKVIPLWKWLLVEETM